jgi:hypothetical protein
MGMAVTVQVYPTAPGRAGQISELVRNQVSTAS